MDATLAKQIARREQVIARVKQILVRELRAVSDEEAIDLDVALFGTGLGLDSVDALELVVAAEAAFGVRFPPDATRASLRSLNSLVDLILAEQDAKESRS